MMPALTSRIRFRIRTVMAIVAVASFVLGYSQWMKRRAAWHGREADALLKLNFEEGMQLTHEILAESRKPSFTSRDYQRFRPREARAYWLIDRYDYHRAMQQRYERAMWRPWSLFTAAPSQPASAPDTNDPRLLR